MLGRGMSTLAFKLTMGLQGGSREIQEQGFTVLQVRDRDAWDQTTSSGVVPLGKDADGDKFKKSVGVNKYKYNHC